MKKRDFSNSSTFYNCRNTPSRNLAENNWQKMKIPNSGLNVFLSGSTGRVYQLQDRSCPEHHVWLLTQINHLH